MTIAWYSRHEPTSRQLASLHQLFGPDVVINQDTRAFDAADIIARRYRESGADELVLVAPLHVVRVLVQRGIQPIWAQMEQCSASHPECEVSLKTRIGRKRHYRFVQFWRVQGIHLDLAPITPTGPKEDSCKLNSLSTAST